MFAREHLGRIARGIVAPFCTEDHPLPKGTIVIAATEMAEAAKRDGENAWNDYRLIGFLGEPPIEIAYDTPIITGVHYLEMGEGDMPTIYISTADDPYNCFPCTLGESVLLLPREAAS